MMKLLRRILFLFILCITSIAVQAKGHDGGGHHGGKHCHHGGGASTQTGDQPTYAIVQPTPLSTGVKVAILVVQVALTLLK